MRLVAAQPGVGSHLMRRTVAAAMLGALALSSCGDEAMSLTEYSEEVAEVIAREDSKLDALGAEVAAAPEDVEMAQTYFDERVASYQRMASGIADLNPPEEASWLHNELERLVAKLLAAEEARAVFAATLVSVDELDQAWEGPEAQAIREAEFEAIELCRVAQQQIDATQDREALEGVPWVPPEMKEVVLVSFNCPR